MRYSSRASKTTWGRRSKRRPQPHLMEDIDAARCQSLATKRSSEIGLALDEGDVDAPAGQEVGERTARRTRADNGNSRRRHDDG